MNHIILIGFKHTGKSVVGQMLAEQLNRSFVDLDEVVENLGAKELGEKLPGRQIVEEHGLDKFRELEKRSLQTVLAEFTEPCVLSLGGGTPLSPENRELIKNHQIVLITAPRGVVFERIMVGGWPAFFPKDEEPVVCFKRIWEEREPIYQALASCVVENNGRVEEAVSQIKQVLHFA